MTPSHTILAPVALLFTLSQCHVFAIPSPDPNPFHLSQYHPHQQQQQQQQQERRTMTDPSVHPSIAAVIKSIQHDIIGTDAGDRGMKPLIVEDDLLLASHAVVHQLPPNSTVLVLSGFPCCVQHTPPTETDGPPGTVAIARAVAACGHQAVIVTEDCNEAVFAAAMADVTGSVRLECFPGTATIVSEADQRVYDDDKDTQQRFYDLVRQCGMIIACERAGPAKDGKCYTMRGIDMTERKLIAPLDQLVAAMRSQDAASATKPKRLFVAIGDGGNELGMGKVIDAVVASPKIAHGDKIGCVVAADHLIAASVSNWGGYALAACIALQQVNSSSTEQQQFGAIQGWIERCLPTDANEIALLDRCVAKGCRDGASGQLEATVDGMPLERSLQCLRDIRKISLSVSETK